MASPLVDAIDALEYLLTARLMPEDYDVEELADALAHGEDGDLGVEPGSVEHKVLSLLVEALPLFAEPLRSGQYSLAHKEMYDRFEKVLEGELERQLKTCGWAVADFHRELASALEEGSSSGAAAGVVAHAAARELLELLGEVANYENWADALKRQAREVALLRGRGGGEEGGEGDSSGAAAGE